MSEPQVLVLPDAAAVAATVAARLLTRLADAQLARGTASVVLTGGGVGIAALTAVRDSAARDTVDWARVDVWWGDERWVPADSPERNDVQAASALLDALPLSAARVHRMGAQRPGATPEGDAEAYAAELAATGGPFDVLLLGMGPEGHTASIFPHSPATGDPRRVVPVHDCPKPPPTRISLGFSALSAAREVWFAVAGGEKAEAVAQAVGGAAPGELPAAGPAGIEQTLWLLDAAAASRLPGP